LEGRGIDSGGVKKTRGKIFLILGEKAQKEKGGNGDLEKREQIRASFSPQNIF